MATSSDMWFLFFSPYFPVVIYCDVLNGFIHLKCWRLIHRPQIIIKVFHIKLNQENVFSFLLFIYVAVSIKAIIEYQCFCSLLYLVWFFIKYDLIEERVNLVVCIHFLSFLSLYPFLDRFFMYSFVLKMSFKFL